MQAVTQPTPTVRQMSGTDPGERTILSVLAKRTYALASDHRLYLAEEQLPLAADVEPHPENALLLGADTDLYPFKVATDVVVKGHAYNLGRAPQFDATVHVGDVSKTVRVTGDRRCTLSSTGSIVFSEPAPADRVPLRYDLAYGGRDVAAEQRHGNPWTELAVSFGPGIDATRVSPYDYPRNPAGRGYLVEKTADAVERLLLPNLEDPHDPVTPERLAVGKVQYWPYMPMPQGVDWVDLGWFPRVAYFGMVPDYESLPYPVPEIARGYSPANLMEHLPPQQKFDFRCANGASLGLQLPYLRGDEWIALDHISPLGSRVAFQLPGERPAISVDGRKGTLKSTQPVIHSVIIEPDAHRVSVVWRGAAPALRPYLPQELERMPLRVEWPR